MNTLAALSRPPGLAKMAYEALRDSILAGRLRPGEVYTEKVLADELGTSKTPVREALLELSSQGLVQFLPRRGIQVTHFCEKDVYEVFEVRRAIETNIVEKVAAAERPPDLTDVDRTVAALRRAVAADDMGAFLEADRGFHDALAALADNGRLLAILGNLRDLIHVMAQEALTRRNRPAEVVEEHEAILEAVRNRSPSAARRAMNRHLELSQDSATEQYRQGLGAILPAPGGTAKGLPTGADDTDGRG